MKCPGSLRNVSLVLFAALAAAWPLSAAAQGPPDIAWLVPGGGAWDVAVTPDGQSVITSTASEMALKLWRTDGTYVRTFGEGVEAYWSMDISPDGQYLLAGRAPVIGLWEEPTAMIYRISDGAMVRGLNTNTDGTQNLVGAVDYLPTGALVAIAYNNYSLGLELYNPTTGALVRTLPGGGYGVRFAPDGQTVVASTWNGPRAWRVSDGAVLHDFPGPAGLFTFSRDGQFLAMTTKPGPAHVRIYRTSDWGLERTITPATVESNWTLEFSPTENLLLLGGSRGSEVPAPLHSDETIDAYRLDGSLAWSYYHSYGQAFKIAFTQNGANFFVAGGWHDGLAPYYEGGFDFTHRHSAATGADLAHFNPVRGGANDVAFSPDGRFFVNATNVTMQVWNAANGAEIYTFPHAAGNVDFSRDGTKLCAVVGNIGVWGVPGYSLLHVLPGHNNGTTDAVFSIEGTMIASGGFDNRVKLRRIADSSLVWTSQSTLAPPLTLASSPDGQIIAAGTRGSTVYLWRASDGALLRTIPGVNVVQKIAFSPDSTMLAVAENAYGNNLKLYRVSDGALLRAFPGSMWGFQKNFVDFTPDGTMLVFSAGAEFIQFWRIADGALLREYDRETGTGLFPIMPIAVSPDGRSFGYGRQDSTIVMARNPFAPSVCYANCDQSTTPPVLNVGDFTCFLQRFASGDPYANCDSSTAPPVLNVGDFTCFLGRFAAGCP
jgi:WD40 repeat protein